VSTRTGLAGARHRAGLIGLILVLAGCSAPLPFIASPTPEQPRQLSVIAVERSSGTPVAGVSVKGGSTTAQTTSSGRATISAMRGATISASAPGFDAATAQVPADGDLTIKLRANVVSGTISDPAGKPLAGARIFVDGTSTSVQSAADGRYALAGVPEKGTLIVKLPGYRLAQLAIDAQMTKNVAMQPFTARALYAPASVFEAHGRLDQMLATIDRTNVNAMVIDIKEAGGYLYYATDLPEAKRAGALMTHPLLNLAELLPKLKARGIYTIARMVVMKDNALAAAQPELAVQNSKTGKPWTDYRGNEWLDPGAPGVAEYITKVATDLADKGFDEVQLDYVRFFSDGDYSVAKTKLPNTQSFRLPAIRRLFRLLSDEFSHRRAFLGADVFPISFIAQDDQGIGQRPEVIMPYVDYFCPMVYPSHYAAYTFGYAVPNEHPYEVINRTLKLMNRQAAGLLMKIRPWIQDFGVGQYRAYTVRDIAAEMKALRDNGTAGWMIWNAAARFTLAALGPPIPDEASGPLTSTAPAPSTAPSTAPSSSPTAAPIGSGSIAPSPTP
jgi:hypothetical protein